MNISRLLDKWLTAMQFTLLCIAPMFFVIAAGVVAYEIYFLHHAMRTQGVVIQMEEVRSTDSDSRTVITYSPVFRFRDAHVEHTVHANSGGNPPVFTVGESVDVLYLPSDPDRAQIASWGEQWGMVVGFGAGALLTGVIGFAMRLVRGQRNFWDYVPFAEPTRR